MTSFDRDKNIESLYNCGITNPATIHDRLKKANIQTSLRTVQRKCKELKEQGFLEPPKHFKKGRKSVLNEEEKMEIEEALEDSPTLNSVELIERINLDCCERTVQRFLINKGYTWKPIYNTFLLTQEQKEERISFAQKHINELWRNTIFIDECTVRLFSGKKFCWQQKGRKVKNERPKHPKKVNICAGISFRGPTRLYLFEENLTGLLYKRILSSAIIPSVKNLYGRDSRFRILHDGDSKHQSIIVQNYLEKENINVVRNWPANSPDLNPIENCWSILKDKL